MTSFSDRVNSGSWFLQGWPLLNDYFGSTMSLSTGSPKVPGMPMFPNPPILDARPIATSATALAASQTVAQGNSIVWKASLTVTAVAVNAAGTAYAVGDVLTATGGTHAAGAEATFLVEQVTTGSAPGNTGGLVGVSILFPGLYSVAPTGITGGNGSSGTLTITTTQVTDPLGNNVAVLDVPRVVTFAFASAPTTTLTVNGWDILNRKTSETISVTATNTTAVTLKAYKYLYSVTSSSATSLTTVTAGVNTSLGLPLPLTGYNNNNYVNAWAVTSAGVVTVDGGTITVGATTQPPTATSGDSLAQYVPAATLNGTNPLTLYFNAPANYINCVSNMADINPNWISGPQPYTAW